MIKVALCDDDTEFMSRTLNRHIRTAALSSSHEIALSEFSDGSAILNSFIKGDHFDIIVLDIEMPDINGKDLARKLRSVDNSFFLVFVSAYPEQVFDTLKYKVNAFIPKNSPESTYISEFVRVFNEYSTYTLQFDIFEILKSGQVSHIKISPDNILAFYLKEHIIYLKTSDSDLILKDTVFRTIKEKYLSYGFFESSRNCLVNIKRIHEISTSSLVLSNGDILPVSRRNRKPLLSEFSLSVMSEVEK